MNRSGGVTAAAVVSLLWSVVTLLFGAGFMFAAFAPTAAATAQMPNFAAYMLTLGAFMVVLSGLGIATAIGLLRLKPWARTSILIFSGFAAPICFLTTAVAAFVPLGDTPGVPTDAGIVRALVIGIYALPLLITVWWLVLFTRPSVRAAFSGGADAPTRPLIVPIIGWGNLVGGLACLVPAVMGMPAFAMGFILRGVAAQVFYLVFGVLSAWLGWSLLKMQERARVLTIGWLGLIGLNSLYATLSPRARASMLEIQNEIGNNRPAAPELDMTAFLIASTVATILLIAAGAWLLMRAKPAFEPPAPAPPAPT